MKPIFRFITLIIAIVLMCLENFSIAQVKYKNYSPGDDLRLSNQYFPEFGVQSWREDDFFNEGYKEFIDEINEHTPYNFLIPFLRFPNYEIVDPIVHDYVKRVTNYAYKKNVQLVPDLDIRNARRAFKAKYPEELQKMLRIKEVEFGSGETVKISIPSIDLSDHYSGGNITHHIPLEGRLLRVYAYNKDKGLVSAKGVKDITEGCKIELESSDSVEVNVPYSKDYTHIAIMVVFAHLYPDIFSPHIKEFQRDIIKQYQDVKIIGVCKDEWGFPPYFPRNYREGLQDFWYSENRAKAYKKITGRDLIFDCLLMAIGEQGNETERISAINHFMNMSRERNTELETDFYHAVKETFGKDAIVSVHSTWWPYPDRNEFKKNGLDWWSAKRDWAQTDEVTPYAVRTALTKKWESPLWYNMYYKTDLAQQMWSSALGGGRIDYLQYSTLLKPELMMAESRIRLLNYISDSPIDSRVAVIFGHAAASNWASPYFDDVGMALVDSLWHTGYATDLIPTYEIRDGNLRVDTDGSIWYGNQKYDAVVLYHPEFEEQSVVRFFNDAAEGSTSLFVLGKWTKDFKGQHFEGDELLPKSMIRVENTSEVFSQLCRDLENKNVRKQSPATSVLDNTYFKLRDFEHSSFAPPTTGMSYLIDGTVIQVAGTKDISGDTIVNNFEVGGKETFVDAIGVVGVRLDSRSQVEALVAGGLKTFKMDGFDVELDRRIDVVLLKNGNGWRGIVQNYEGEIPESLTKITKNWTRLRMPDLIKKSNHTYKDDE